MNPLTNLNIALSELLQPVIVQCVKEAFNSLPVLTTPPGTSPLDPNRYGTPEQVCEHFNLPLATFRQKWAKQITHCKRGKRTFYRFSDVEAWLNEGRVKTSHEISEEAQSHIDNLKTARTK